MPRTHCQRRRRLHCRPGLSVRRSPGGGLAFASADAGPRRHRRGEHKDSLVARKLPCYAAQDHAQRGCQYEREHEYGSERRRRGPGEEHRRHRRPAHQVSEGFATIVATYSTTRYLPTTYPPPIRHLPNTYTPSSVRQRARSARVWGARRVS